MEETETTHLKKRERQGKNKHVKDQQQKKMRWTSMWFQDGELLLWTKDFSIKQKLFSLE